MDKTDAKHVDAIIKDIGISQVLEGSGLDRDMVYQIRTGRRSASPEHALRLHGFNESFRPRAIAPHLFNVLDELGLAIVRKHDGKPIDS